MRQKSNLKFMPPTANEAIERFLSGKAGAYTPEQRARIRECAAKMIHFYACCEKKDRNREGQPLHTAWAKQVLAGMPMHKALARVLDYAAWAAPGVSAGSGAMTGARWGPSSSVILSNKKIMW
jgi:hypothetical protein